MRSQNKKNKGLPRDPWDAIDTMLGSLISAPGRWIPRANVESIVKQVENKQSALHLSLALSMHVHLYIYKYHFIFIYVYILSIYVLSIFMYKD